MVYVFGRCELDLSRLELRVDGSARRLEPQAFDVLAVLFAERHRVVLKEELLDRVWGHRFVGESALTSRIKSVRRAVGDDGTSQLIVRTVRGRGYQFIADATEQVVRFTARRWTPIRYQKRRVSRRSHPHAMRPR